MWIGYDDTDRTWRVYKDDGGITTVGSSLVGDPHAVARVTVASGSASFEVSYDGVLWHTLHTQAGTWTWRVYIIQDSTIYTVFREQRS